jgi:hypothetical protein
MAVSRERGPKTAGWHWGLALLLGLLLMGTGSLARAGAKTDVIYLLNGDRITCEIKRLDRGRVEASTSGMGTVFIEWDDIARVESPMVFQVELQSGERINGALVASKDGTLLIKEDAPGRQVAMAKVVRIDPLKTNQSRLYRWDGSISAGFDTTKASQTTSLTANADARYRGDNYLVNLDAGLYSYSQDDAEDSTWASASAVYRRLLADRWYWALFGSAERNDELGLDLRLQGGAGGGRFLIQDSRSLWSATAALAVARETPIDGETTTESAAVFVTNYEYYVYDTPKTTITLNLAVLPYLTESGRVRATLDTGVRYELVEDLFFDLSLYGEYDSKALESTTETDYGLVTSLGYTF